MKNTLQKTLAGAIAALAMLITGCGPSQPVLNVYSWSDYIDEGLVSDFEKQNNCKVIIDTFDSNEFMYSKLKAGAKGYDVIVPTSYMAKLMFEQKLIEPLDLSKIPNAQKIDKLPVKLLLLKARRDRLRQDSTSLTKKQSMQLKLLLSLRKTKKLNIL